MTGVIKASPLPPGLPEVILATNLTGRQHWDFKVDAFTNRSRMSVPLRGSLNGYMQRSPEPWSRIRFDAHQLIVPAPDTEFRLKIDGTNNSVVLDSTHRNAPKPFKARFLTNKWPSEKEVQAFGETQMVPRTKDVPTQEPVRKRGPILLFIACLVIGPMIFAYHFLKKPQKLKQ